MSAWERVGKHAHKCEKQSESEGKTHAYETKSEDPHMDQKRVGKGVDAHEIWEWMRIRYEIGEGFQEE